jgi:hypothetical protein
MPRIIFHIPRFLDARLDARSIGNRCEMCTHCNGRSIRISIFFLTLFLETSIHSVTATQALQTRENRNHGNQEGSSQEAGHQEGGYKEVSKQEKVSSYITGNIFGGRRQASPEVFLRSSPLHCFQPDVPDPLFPDPFFPDPFFPDPFFPARCFPDLCFPDPFFPDPCFPDSLFFLIRASPIRFSPP